MVAGLKGSGLGGPCREIDQIDETNKHSEALLETVCWNDFRPQPVCVLLEQWDGLFGSACMILVIDVIACVPALEERLPWKKGGTKGRSVLYVYRRHTCSEIDE